MSDNLIALIGTIVIIALIFAWVPLLNLICSSCARLLQRRRLQKDANKKQKMPHTRDGYLREALNSVLTSIADLGQTSFQRWHDRKERHATKNPSTYTRPLARTRRFVRCQRSMQRLLVHVLAHRCGLPQAIRQ